MLIKTLFHPDLQTWRGRQCYLRAGYDDGDDDDGDDDDDDDDDDGDNVTSGLDMSSSWRAGSPRSRTVCPSPVSHRETNLKNICWWESQY